MKANAVFSGGGIRGIAFVGALQTATEQGLIIERLAGTSAGALVATLVASGYTAQEIYELICNFDFKKILDGDFRRQLPTLDIFTSIFLEKGLYRGRALENWVRSLLQAKKISTFADLKPGKLSIIAADLTLNKMIVLPDDLVHYGLDAKKFSIATAVRMSASLPFVFEPVVLKYGKKASYIVDGGLVSNFPSWLFKDDPRPTLGFCFQNEPEQRRIKNLWDYALAIIGTAIGDIHHNNKVKTIAIPTSGIGTVDFELSHKQKERLYLAGQGAAESFFATNSF